MDMANFLRHTRIYVNEAFLRWYNKDMAKYEKGVICYLHKQFYKKHRMGVKISYKVEGKVSTTIDLQRRRIDMAKAAKQQPTMRPENMIHVCSFHNN